MTPSIDIAFLILANATKKQPQPIKIKHRGHSHLIQEPDKHLEKVFKSPPLAMSHQESIIIYGDTMDLKKEKFCIDVELESNIWFQVKEIKLTDSPNQRAWELTIKANDGESITDPRDVNVSVGDPE
jgi:hypothetical protein